MEKIIVAEIMSENIGLVLVTPESKFNRIIDKVKQYVSREDSDKFMKIELHDGQTFYIKASDVHTIRVVDTSEYEGQTVSAVAAEYAAKTKADELAADAINGFMDGMRAAAARAAKNLDRMKADANNEKSE